MKKTTIITILLLVSVPFLFSQNTVKTNIKETDYSKSKMFSLTKMFVADKWNNPKLATVNSDEELGVIQINTQKEIDVKVGMGLTCVYTYNYKVKFQFKENKYKIDIYDIECVSAEQVGLGSFNTVPLIQYFEGDNPPEKTKKMGRGVSKKQAVKIMELLRSDFESLFDDYNSYINSYKEDF